MSSPSEGEDEDHVELVLHILYGAENISDRGRFVEACKKRPYPGPERKK